MKVATLELKRLCILSLSVYQEMKNNIL